MEIKAPEEWFRSADTAIFLAGGISDCPDWQNDLVEKLKEARSPLVLLNPRRTSFDIKDDKVAVAQIEWECRHIAKADVVLFWFPKETLCPITLLEFGKCLATQKDIIVGVEVGYQRDFDVKVQLDWHRLHQSWAVPPIYRSIDEMVQTLVTPEKRIGSWLNNKWWIK
jgi:hypothetical protein